MVEQVDANVVHWIIKVQCLSVSWIVSCCPWQLKTLQNFIFFPLTSFWGLSQSVVVVQQLKSRLHYKLLETEGLPIPHGWTASWFSHIFPSSLFILFCIIPSPFSSLLLSQMWLQQSSPFISLPTTLPSDYFSALLSIFPNPFVQIFLTYITFSQLLVCHTPSFAVTKHNPYQFCTCSCIISQFFLIYPSALFIFSPSSFLSLRRWGWIVSINFENASMVLFINISLSFLLSPSSLLQRTVFLRLWWWTKAWCWMKTLWRSWPHCSCQLATKTASQASLFTASPNSQTWVTWSTPPAQVATMSVFQVLELNITYLLIYKSTYWTIHYISYNNTKKEWKQKNNRTEFILAVSIWNDTTPNSYQQLHTSTRNLYIEQS